MEIKKAIKARKSIRSFKSDPVSKEVIQEIIEIAIQSPSAMNTQPWEIYVVGGDLLDKIRQENVEQLVSGNMPAPDINPGGKNEGVYKKRQVDLAIQLFELMKITRDDKENKFKWIQRGFRYFDAPVAIMLAFDESLEPAVLPFFDLGAITHAICLTALDYDLGTCIHGQGIQYPQIIRKHIDIPINKKILISISIGYPDWDFPANKIESSRELPETNTVWYGF